MENEPSDGETILAGRRTTLKALGNAALAVSMSGLAACSTEDSAPERPASDAESAARSINDAASDRIENEAVDSMGGTMDAGVSGADLPRLDQSGRQAQAFGYVSDASGIDVSAQPTYKAGQACANCSLFLGDEGDQWGPCSIFPGLAVSTAGWCSVYAAKA